MIQLADERRKARKPHRCDMCNRQIGVGETYKHQRNIVDAEIYTYRECPHCTAMVWLLSIDYSGYDWGFGFFDMVEYEPGTIFEARLKVMWRNSWRRKDGTLYPIPYDTKE